MKQSPGERNQRHNLEASFFSAGGFLGDDPRPLDEIIAADERALEKAGVSREQLVDALKDIYQRAKEGFGAPIALDEHRSVTFHESMGRIPSPFRGDGVFEKGEAVLTDARTEEHLIITALSIALIEKHGFFQGTGSRYRIDPAQAVRLLGIGER
ncbi:MAG: hypothetical protein GF331_12135 [Chitinivibrionales bacterium]|nr:hypothetical protein [Chitinivibrionales bacterium]